MFTGRQESTKHRNMQVLRYIAEGWREYEPRTYREIADEFELAGPSGALYVVNCLRADGLIEPKQESRRYWIRLTPAGWKALEAHAWQP